MGGLGVQPRAAHNAQEFTLKLQKLLLQPPSQPQFLPLLKENRRFGETAMLSDAERTPHPHHWHEMLHPLSSPQKGSSGSDPSHAARDGPTVTRPLALTRGC